MVVGNSQEIKMRGFILNFIKVTWKTFLPGIKSGIPVQCKDSFNNHCIELFEGSCMQYTKRTP